MKIRDERGAYVEEDRIEERREQERRNLWFVKRLTGSVVVGEGRWWRESSIGHVLPEVSLSITPAVLFNAGILLYQCATSCFLQQGIMGGGWEGRTNSLVQTLVPSAGQWRRSRRGPGREQTETAWGGRWTCGRLPWQLILSVCVSVHGEKGRASGGKRESFMLEHSDVCMHSSVPWCVCVCVCVWVCLCVCFCVFMCLFES